MDRSRHDMTGLSGARRTIAAASLGNMLEWYDFTVYALFALYIAAAFFPDPDPASALIQTFLAFGIGFLVRPAGALLLGAYADRHGRKAALTFTIILMAVGTGLIAIAPPAAVIGVGAPLLLLTGRALQGFSAGGEVGGALSFLVEHAPPGRRAEYAAWLQASMAASNLLGAFMAFLLTHLLSPAAMGLWGWRVAFAVGLLIAPLGLWLRRTLDETPEYRLHADARATHLSDVRPLRTFLAAVRQRPSVLLAGIGISILWTSGSYALVIFFPTYAQRTLGFSAGQAFTASLVSNVAMVGACLSGGRLADRIGHRRLLLILAAILCVAPHPLLWIAASTSSTATLTVVQSLLCAAVGLFVGAAPAALSALFPVGIRATGSSIAYNIAVMLFGGFAPAILSWLISRGQPFAPAWYVSVAALLALPALFALHRTRHIEPSGLAPAGIAS
ncbi:MAG TPA: MFS transporter [Novosphingobium sp.]|nr:MFS transporter [Novosphingobium sp.]